jgi:hypothetical protein
VGIETQPQPAGQRSQAAQAVEGAARQLRLAFASFLLLFVELALIRWTEANNVYLASATNLVLLASFLGIGLGFLNARSRRDFLRWTPLALLAIVAFVLAFPVTLATLSGPHPYRGLGGAPALPRPVSLGVIFLLSVAVMAGIGQGVARLFVGFRPLRAYRLDVLGSIAGIGAFSLLSFLDLAPVAWGLIAGAGLLALLARRDSGPRWRRPGGVPLWQWAVVAGVVVLLGLESVTPDQLWSPYYKLTYAWRGTRAQALYVTANNIPYQAARSLAVMREQKQFYFYPYRHVTQASLRNVLIIGAGTGNDVAVALFEHARHVDAVDIDPVLLRIGRARHPDHPYSSPRVTTHVADGREYLQDTHARYNLILFALPDSLTALAGQSNLRLESYLLTEQSISQARAHLAPGGTFAMYNYYAPFLLARYATTVETAFRKRPCVEIGPPLGGRRLAVITVRASGTVPDCASSWNGRHVAPATDDHPFPYLAGYTIPAQYLWMLGAILAVAVIGVITVGGRPRRMAGYFDLACMGAAFMLLETKNIVGFALLFGATWFVNSLVFAAVLAAVYLAVETAGRVRLPRPAALYLALAAALALAWAIPGDLLLTLPVIPRFLAGGALAFAPVFLANLIFAQRFAGTQASATAFAANLLGAMVGGALEYLALVTGYRFLIIVIAILYGLAFVSGRLMGRQRAPA